MADPKTTDPTASLAALTVSNDPATQARRAMGWTHTARFLTTASRLDQLPQSELPEIAFVGRSNAGKSTAINTLTQQKRLAFASKTPGRTQHINLFELGPRDAADALFADLPGYGYAAVSRTDKQRWQKVMTDYLDVRRSLAGVVLMVDPRLGFTDLDLQLLDFVGPRLTNGSVKLLVLLTKADKLNRRDADRALQQARDTLAGISTEESDIGVTLFSALSKRGVDDTAVVLRSWVESSARPCGAGGVTVETFTATLPGGIELSCRAAGTPGAPLLVFLHGFPEAAFVWDGLLEHFAPRYRCIAPNLRGYERSSAPSDTAAYRVKHLVGDIRALIAQQGGRAAALIAHDWGGALAWGLAAQHPESIERLVIINSPHPATFLRELRDNAQQQASSAYMNFLCRPDAEKLLAENDFARLWTFFERMGATDPAHPGGGWLSDAVRERYRDVWRQGLTGGCNYYRASPLRPPLSPGDTIMGLQLPPEMVTVRVPTLVIWAEADTALPPALLDGLEAYVPDMHLVRVPGATHWIVHERPALVAQEIDRALAR